MKFLKKIKSSIYDPAFYHRVPKESLGSALRYFLLLTLFLTTIRVVFLIVPITVGINQLTHNLSTNLLQAYPEYLTISIHDGLVHTNVGEPFFIPLPFLDSSKNFLVIDTQTPFSAEQFNRYDSYVWLSKDTVFYTGDINGQLRAYSLAKVKDFTLNKEVVRNVVVMISPWFRFLSPMLLLFIFIVLYIGYLFSLIYLFLLAFIFWLIAKKLVPGLRYSNSYKIALHAVTLGFILSAGIVMLNAYTHFYAFPFMETIVAIAVFVGNYWNTKAIKKASGRRKR